MLMTATYSPDDNRLRLSSFARLDADLYARVKAAGFRWAPHQKIFICPRWTPAAEDLCIELCGEIDDEDTTLAERAEDRAERFENYSDKRKADAGRAHAAVAAIADNIPLGQPILVGHHSERHARKDAQRIENGMRRAVKMWDTANYWTGRAAGAIANAKYKEQPAVRARRIKGIEADLRKVERSKTNNEMGLKAWGFAPMSIALATRIANTMHASHCFTLAEFPRVPPLSQYEGHMSFYTCRPHSERLMNASLRRHPHPPSHPPRNRARASWKRA